MVVEATVRHQDNESWIPLRIRYESFLMSKTLVVIFPVLRNKSHLAD